MKIDHSLFYEGSFADEKVFDVCLDVQGKKITFTISGAQTEDGEGKEINYKNVKFLISNWWESKVFNIEPSSQESYLVELEDYDFLEEVSIYNFTNNQLILEGFGKKSMLWKKYIFIKPLISLTVD